MPLFEYRCECGKVFEVLKMFNNARKTERCLCGEQAVKIMSRVQIRVFDPSSFDGDTQRRLCGIPN